MEGVRGRHYQGDIAIDDLSITAGFCDSDKVNGKTMFLCFICLSSRHLDSKQLSDQTFLKAEGSSYHLQVLRFRIQNWMIFHPTTESDEFREHLNIHILSTFTTLFCSNMS